MGNQAAQRVLTKLNQLKDVQKFIAPGDIGKIPTWDGVKFVPVAPGGIDLAGKADLAGAIFTGPILAPSILVGAGGLDLDGNGIGGLFSMVFNTDGRIEIGDPNGTFGIYDSGEIGRLVINNEEQEINLRYDTIVTGNLAVSGTINGSGAGLNSIPSSALVGLLPSAVIPPLAITQPFPVANQAAMLALTAQRGDVAIRADNGKSYILSTDSPATLADWLELTGAGGVSAWNGLSGNIVATTANLPESGDSLYYTAARAALKAPIANANLTGTTTVNVLNAGGLITALSGGRLSNFTFNDPFAGDFAIAYHHSLVDPLNYAILQDSTGHTRLNGASAALYVGNNSRFLIDASAHYFFGNDGNLQATLFPGSRATLGNAYHFTLDVAGIVNAGDYLIGQDSATPQLELVGDSLTVGWLAPHPYDFYMAIPTYNGIAFNKTNLGVNSSTLKDAIRGAYSTINPLYANKSGMNVIGCWLGTNDIVLDGDTPAQAFSTLQELGRKQRSKGYKFVAATMISRNGADAAKNAFNALIRAHWAEFADGIADLAANANLGADGAYSNPIYFNADGIHLTEAGQVLVAAIFQATLIQVITNSANKTFNGTVSAPQFLGGGVGLTGLDAANLASGTVAPARLAIVESKPIVFNGRPGVVTVADSEVDFTIAFNCLIVGWTLLADAAGNLTVEVDKCSIGSYPVSLTSIWGTKPSLSASQVNSASGLTISVTAGDSFRARLSGTPTVIKNATLTLNYLRT